MCAFACVVGSTAIAQDKAPSSAKPTLNLNSATLDQLQDLPGVGRATAERILEYRQKNGGFKKIEELMNVKGIGEKSFLKCEEPSFYWLRVTRREPVRIGNSNLLSFSPVGTATSGTIYLAGRAGTQVCVRVLGVTGRGRVLRFDRTAGVWRQD